MLIKRILSACLDFLMPSRVVEREEQSEFAEVERRYRAFMEKYDEVRTNDNSITRMECTNAFQAFFRKAEFFWEDRRYSKGSKAKVQRMYNEAYPKRMTLG